MPRTTLDPNEPVYVISVAARIVSLHPQTLRHYERLGLVEPARTGKGLRMYSQQDIEQLRKITRLMDELGVNLAGVEVILNMSRQIEELQAKVEWMEAQVQGEASGERRGQSSLSDHRQGQALLPEDTTR